MIMNETRLLINSLIQNANVTNFRVEDAKELVHYDEPSIAENDYETDIVITEHLYEWQLRKVVKIVQKFQQRHKSNASIRMCEDGLRIFERAKEKAET